MGPDLCLNTHGLSLSYHYMFELTCSKCPTKVANAYSYVRRSHLLLLHIMRNATPSIFPSICDVEQKEIEEKKDELVEIFDKLSAEASTLNR